SDWAGDVLIWNVQQATSFGLPRSDLWVLGVTFSSDGKWLAHSGSIISIYSDISQPEFERVNVLGAHTSSLAFSPGGQVLASGGGQSELSVSLWDVATWRPLGRPPEPAGEHPQPGF
ncbi:MAG: hypothetical protein ACT4QE_10505, partial [Anaerolineales bacterium]